MAPHEIPITESISFKPAGRKKIDSILRVRGTQIVDGHNDPVVLKGV